MSSGNDTSSINTQDCVLLEALQEFILPLIGAAAERKPAKDNQGSPPGHEAIVLITVLREFIAHVVGDTKSTTQTTVNIPLIEQSAHLVLEDDADVSPTSAKTNEFKTPELSLVLSPPRATFHEMVLRELQNHVFNRMPIRLLRFEPVGSRLQISLIERGTIYAHLVRVMEANMSQPDYCLEEYEVPETYDEATARLIGKYAGYAILSHTWLRGSPGEVTYDDWNAGLFDETSAGYQKIINFCKAAWTIHGLTLGWMDTVCINKQSSSELDESIRSMYKWYQGASVCIIYLAETQNILDIHTDPWFTRGWTLQELLAPQYIKFYNRDWTCFVTDTSSNDKSESPVSREIVAQITEATTITHRELPYIHGAPLSRRMQLAAPRKVTREEDTAYSLMGIFNVSIATAYGEGVERSFTRLLHEILNSTSIGILDLFNWAGSTSRGVTQLIPRSIKNYERRSPSTDLVHVYPLAPLTLTHMGLRITVLLMSGLFRDAHSPPPDRFGTFWATLNTVVPLFDPINLATFYASGDIFDTPQRFKLAVFNVNWQGSDTVRIPRICTAKLISAYPTAGEQYSVYDTEEPIIFELKNAPDRFSERNGDSFVVPTNEYAAHGIELASLYL
ncbi:hypothetical protein BDN70DRAFT_887386 [Pholiota conissans]|uniref:Heterokaryon incompatibility domain-containing protein n=1 Tax=Pholiota conissans TaxID=109636 RepID=A0A9P6CTH4_9AGAR|nr:hypothetical protein BDN70DRAFT_887386 [Pholiota conissans]